MFGKGMHVVYYNGNMYDVLRRSVWMWQGTFGGKGFKSIKHAPIWSSRQQHI